MSNLLFYIVSSSVCLAIFVLGYLIFLRNNTRFNLCRFYLVTAILLSFLIPSMPIDFGISSIFTSKPQIITRADIESITQLTNQGVVNESLPSSKWTLAENYVQVIVALLLSISFLLFIRFIHRFGAIILIQISGDRMKNDEGLSLIFTDKTDNAFSFLGNIFINPLKFNDEEKRLIIKHEREHIRHLHSIDLILIELLIVIQWFNPFAYTARRKLIEIHEFIADNGVIRNGADPYSYQNLLLSVVTTSCLPSAGNQLSAFITKKRIAMIGKPMNQTGKWANFLILIPIAAILILGISAFSPKELVNDNFKMGKSLPVLQQDDLLSLKEPIRSIEEEEKRVLANRQANFSSPNESISTNVENEKLTPIKQLSILALPNKSIIKSTEIGKLLTIKQQESKSTQEVQLERVMKGIGNDLFLKDFYNNLEPNNSQRYSIILKRNIEYNLYYLSTNNSAKFHVLIESVDSDVKETVSEFDFSNSAKIGIAPKKTMAYLLSVSNQSSRIDDVTYVLTQKDGKIKNVAEYPAMQSKDTSKADDDVYLVVEEMPSFGNGDPNEFRTWIAANIQYPKEAFEKGIQGRVFVQYVVEADGRVTNVKVLRGVDPALDKEAIRVMESSPKWNPGKQRGKPVRVSYTFPIIFAIQ